MKIHAYRAVQRGPRGLTELLNALNAKPLRERVFEAGAGGMRLEAVRQDGQLMFADFSNDRRGHGPGRRSADFPVREFVMDPGDQFAEDTALLYDGASGYIALQYNHAGPRIGAIDKYLFAADMALGGGAPAAPGQANKDRFGFGFGAVLRPDAMARLRGIGIYKTLEFAVSVPGVRAEDLDAGRSLGAVLDAPLPEGIDTLKIVMSTSARRDSALGEGGVMGFINDLQRAGSAVKSALVSGKNQDSGLTEKVDLVEDRIAEDIRLRLGHGLRYVREDRWDALQQALQRWSAADLLPRVAR